LHSDSASNVTGLLRAWTAGNEAALDQLLPKLEGELRRIARRYMARERKDHTLQPTALVNEAFLRLVGVKGVEWQDRAHFLALAAKIMRRILVNHALSRGAAKRGAGGRAEPLDEAIVISPDRDADLIELDAALEALAAVDPRKARMVELRFFGIAIQWREGLPEERSFVVRIVEFAPRTAGADALASTNIARGEIAVYDRRVRDSLRRVHPAAGKLALAFVLAHELAHAMQGIAWHSSSGILRARWSNDDFTAMIFNRLAFTSADADLMRRRVLLRWAEPAEK